MSPVTALVFPFTDLIPLANLALRPFSQHLHSPLLAFPSHQPLPARSDVAPTPPSSLPPSSNVLPFPHRNPIMSGQPASHSQLLTSPQCDSSPSSPVPAQFSSLRRHPRCFIYARRSVHSLADSCKRPRRRTIERSGAPTSRSATPAASICPSPCRGQSGALAYSVWRSL